MIGPKGWITPTGALRDRNWKMQISFNDELGSYDTLCALQEFCRRLDAKYGKRSFGFFAKGDMRVFQEVNS
jgi:hypothetical protein